MLNRILLAFTIALAIAVIFLFYKVSALTPETADETTEQMADETNADSSGTAAPVMEAGRTPTGKIAYVDIDRLNEESLEIIDLIAETKRKKERIEKSVEQLSIDYQRKVEEFQQSQKAGIAPESELRRKAQEIEGIEREAQEKQMMMDRLGMEINDKNADFQKNVRDYLSKWNNGRYDFVLSLSEALPSMLIGNPSLEVTDEIIKGLNDEYKSRKSSKKK